jgi:O-acetyl-ADP-ribose deacetylase (regulator of RNase III)
MITYVQGDILEDDADVIVIPVNLVGTMGAGLARQAAVRWPHIVPPYRQACRERQLCFGRVLLLSRVPGQFQPTVALVPTKGHYRERSHLDWVVISLEAMRRVIGSSTPLVPTWACPSLGCGLGGLDWVDVRPEMERVLGDLPNTIRIYEPQSSA